MESRPDKASPGVGSNSPTSTASATSEALDTPSSDVVLKARSIVKNYGSTKALQGADLVLGAGRVHALMGENGAGKSTLVRILVGATAPSAGTIALHGRTLKFNGVSDAIAAGIVPIYQQSTLFPNLTVLENLFAFETAALPGFVNFSSPRRRRLAQRMLDRIGLSVALDRAVGTLSLGEKQLLEIARGLGHDCKVLILDEPTAALSQADANRLFLALRRLAVQGVAILYISHKTDEIQQIADEITVLRDGVSVIAAAPLKSTSIQAIVNAMVGHTFSVGEKNLPAVGVPLLELDRAARYAGSPEVSVMVRACEILGVAGLAGSGAEEIGAILAGVLPCVRGNLLVNGRPLSRMGDRAVAVAAGIGYVPPDRIADGLFPGQMALRNASASALAHLGRFGWLNQRMEFTRLSRVLSAVTLTPNEPWRVIEEFSGGNQQKVLLARNLAVIEVKALVLVEPTRGVDVGAREIIHEEIVRAARNGLAIALVSTDLEELTSLSHRIAIVRGRRIVEELPRFSSPAAVAKAMLGESR
jgi:ABC-type sugar transport system ATPase subunit